MNSDIASEYRAAREGAVFSRIENAGYLRIAGEDRIDFLNRQSTNDVRALAADRAVTTVLTSAVARIQDVLLLVEEKDGTMGAITLEGHAAATARLLRGKIFFMDKVTLQDASAEMAHFDIDGPQAGGVLSQLNAQLPPAGGVTSFLCGNALVSVVGRSGLAGHGYHLLLPAAQADVLAQALAEAGATAISAETRHVLRVERGLPAAGAELTEDYSPLEANLEDAISEHKGCYTGQEVIARQISYDKVARRLVGLRMAGPVAAGAQVLAGGKSAGVVTSVTNSPRFGHIALAYVRRPHHEPGSEVTVVQDGAELPATTSALPFTA